MKKMLGILIMVCIAYSAYAQTKQPQQSTMDASMQPLYVKLKDIKWEKTDPELGDKSPEIAFLYTDPKTKATQLMIRIPPNTHVPKHWHTANETHTIVSGTFVMKCYGKKVELGAGSFNYMPSKMVHEAWHFLQD